MTGRSFGLPLIVGASAERTEMDRRPNLNHNMGRGSHIVHIVEGFCLSRDASRSLSVLRRPVEIAADCVEKLGNSDSAIFGQKPIKPRSQMRSFRRRRELTHEWRKANLAEPVATKSWSACTARKSTRAKNGVFNTIGSKLPCGSAAPDFAHPWMR